MVTRIPGFRKAGPNQETRRSSVSARRRRQPQAKKKKSALQTRENMIGYTLFGALAQLVAHNTGSVGVRSSNLLCSTSGSLINQGSRLFMPFDFDRKSVQKPKRPTHDLPFFFFAQKKPKTTYHDLPDFYFCPKTKMDYLPVVRNLNLPRMKCSAT